MRADRLPRVTITPFSVEKESEGRPWMFQSRTAVALERNTAKLNLGEHGTFNSLNYKIKSIGKQKKIYKQCGKKTLYVCIAYAYLHTHTLMHTYFYRT